MSEREPFPEEVTNPSRALPLPDASPGECRLVVVGEGAPVTHPLPMRSVLLGRSSEADISIDDTSLSRRHAVLSVGPRLFVQDCGSTNGTRVRGVRLRPNEVTEVHPGEVIELGSVMVIVQRSEAAPTPIRRIWPHGYFDARLEEECLRASRGGTRFALLRVRLEGELSSEQQEAVLDTMARLTTVVASWGPQEYELLLEGADASRGREVAVWLALDAARRNTTLTTGLAAFPDDGRSAAELIARAGSALRGSPNAPEHTEPISIIGSPMERLRALVARVAQGNISVILEGETGVGKEVTARMLHRYSRRSTGPFVGINCGALAESLLESELFGHEKGAFTGAVKAKPGLLEAAEGGTLFFDEIGEMPQALQVKLLRVLEERAVLRVGAVKPRPIDVRLVAATHRNLEEAVQRGSFRQDLYYRLNGITLQIPPLRERTQELEGLVRTFIEEFSRADGRTPPVMEPVALELVKSYAWPGNVRELRNVVERAVTLCTGDTIRLEHLPVEKMGTMLRPVPASAPVPSSLPSPIPTPPPGRFEPVITNPMGQAAPARFDAVTTNPSASTAPVALADRIRTDEIPARGLKDALKAVEKERILEALQQCAGNQSRAAEVLGMSRRALVNRLDEYGIPRPRKRE